MSRSPFSSLLNSLGRAAVREGTKYVRRRLSQGQSTGSQRTSAPARTGTPRPQGSHRRNDGEYASAGMRGKARSYPGDFTGAVQPAYSPSADGNADPGEIVWGWVPFEEDPAQGKDRPVLVVGLDGDWLLSLMLTSRDRAPGKGQLRTESGATWLDVGPGPWDAKGRPSEIRLDRVVRVDPAQVRREGAIISRELFDSVVANMNRARRG